MLYKGVLMLEREQVSCRDKLIDPLCKCKHKFFFICVFSIIRKFMRNTRSTVDKIIQRSSSRKKRKVIP